MCLDINIQFLKEKSRYVRICALNMVVNAKKGHLGGTFSATDILVTIYYSGLFKFDPNNPERDRFILSKGHSCPALYAILADLGFFSISELDTFCKNDSRLGGHPDRNIPGIEVNTGSLGHGLSIGTGMVLATKLDNKNFKTIVLLGDCECHEGSIWESVMFSGHHKLGNLIVVVDYNKQCATDFAEDSINLDPFADKWKAFNLDVRIVDGHSFPELINNFNDIQRRQAKPTVIIARTIKGKGISYMERNLDYHHKIPTEDDVEIALKELSGN